jgi:hypothetical protein
MVTNMSHLKYQIFEGLLHLNATHTIVEVGKSRPAICPISYKEIETAFTYDQYWNTALLELVATGKVRGSRFFIFFVLEKEAPCRL